MKPHQPFSSIHVGIAVSILMLAACSGTDSLDSAQPTLGLSYDLSGLNVGDVLEVEVQVSGMHDVYGVALDLVYDPSLFEYQNATSGPFLSRDGGGMVFAAALEDESPGRIVAGVSLVGSSPGVSGHGVVMTVDLLIREGLATDDTLSLEAVHVFDSKLDDIVLKLGY